MKQRFTCIVVLLLACLSAPAQAGFNDGVSLDITACTSDRVSDVPNHLCWDAVGHQFKYWDGAAWQVTASGGGGVPAGADIVMFSGACPAGFTEDTAAQGFYIIGRPNTGTVGNSIGVAVAGASPPDTSYTPLGSNSSNSAGTPAGTNSAPALTMNSYTPAGTNGSVSITPLGSNGTGTVTPLGTNNACATVKFTTSGSGTAACSPAFTPTFTGSSSTTSAEIFTGSSTTIPAETFTGTPATLTGSVAAPTFTGTAMSAHTHTYTGTANGTMRSVIAPAKYAIFCKKD